MEIKILKLKVLGLFFIILYTWFFFFHIKRFFPWKIFNKKITYKWYIYSSISISMFSVCFLPLSRKLSDLVTGILLFSLFGVLNLALTAKKMSIQSAEHFRNEGDLENAIKFENRAQKINYKIKETVVIFSIIAIATAIKICFFE